MFFGMDVWGRHTSGPQTFPPAPFTGSAGEHHPCRRYAAAAPFQDDPDWDEVCRRGLAVTTLQNWYLMPFVTNQLFDEE